MKRPQITSGENIARAHQAKVPEVIATVETIESVEAYHPRKFARALLQKIYPGLTIDKTPVSVHKRVAMDYKKYSEMERDALAFGEVHVIGMSETLSDGNLLGELVTLSAKKGEMDTPLSSFLPKARETMAGYYPAGLKTLYEILQDPKAFLTPPSSFLKANEGILIPGALFRNPDGVWCAPLLFMGDGTSPQVKLSPLQEAAHDKRALFLTK